MAKNSAANLLTSVDSLFTTQEERDIASQPRVQEIPVDKIDDFPNHPFKVRMDDNMIEMAESVKQHGILVPAIVRPKENGHYEMVAGHRQTGVYPDCKAATALHCPGTHGRGSDRNYGGFQFTAGAASAVGKSLCL